MAERPSNEEIFAKLDETRERLDTERIEGLKRMRVLQDIKKNSLEREKARLVEKYGADHPRARKVARRVAYDQSRIRELDAEIERSEIVPGEFDRNTWLVHGRVIDADGGPVEGAIVSVVDESSKPVEALGQATTDIRGYYELRYVVEEGEQPVLDEGDDLFVTATDDEGAVVYRDETPLHVAVGLIDYRIIVFSEASTELPPEDEEPDIPSDAWVTRGTVRLANREAAAGVVVSLYDKDLVFDDHLGTTVTDQSGRFSIVYRAEAFRDLFEQRPDLYIKVMDQNGRRLYGSRRTVRCEAGRIEEFDIVIKGSVTRRSRR